jgi:PAS domain-containing protein
MAIGAPSHKRRRRRRSSRSRVVTPPVRHSPVGRQFRLHSAEVLGSIGILVATATLIALIWLIANRSIETERGDLRARIEATIHGQSLILADQIRRELLGIQQSLTILKEAFQADPDHFDMTAWRKQMPALTDVTDDAFIADAQFVIRHDINPPEVGLGIGSRVAGMYGSETEKPDPEEDQVTDQTRQKLQTRQHLSLMLLRLTHPGGWIVGANYRTDALRRLFAEADLGLRGMTALIDTRLGRVQAIAGPAAANANYDIATSPMYAATQLRPDGTWIGPSAPDGVQRIHAFRQVPGHKFVVVVAVDEAEAMRPAIAWAQDVRSLALASTLVVLAAAGVALYALWTFRAKRRLRQTLEREQLLATNAQAELVDVRARLGGRAGQMQALFGGIEEGVLVLDAERRVSEWNQRFPELFGIASEAPQRGMQLDELVRAQALEGAFGALEDPEREVATRLAQLQAGSGTRPSLYAAPGGHTLAVFATQHADGSLLLVMREATEHDLRQVPEEPEAEILEATPTPGSAAAV